MGRGVQGPRKLAGGMWFQCQVRGHAVPVTVSLPLISGHLSHDPDQQPTLLTNCADFPSGYNLKFVILTVSYRPVPPAHNLLATNTSTYAPLVFKLVLV